MLTFVITADHYESLHGGALGNVHEPQHGFPSRFRSVVSFRCHLEGETLPSAMSFAVTRPWARYVLV